MQTPFENLSQVEKFQLLRKWRKTLMVSNNQWNKSHLGKLGQVRGKYNDPWPSPITKMDIKLYQKDDRHYQSALKQTKEVNRSMKNKKRFETDSDYLENQSMYNMNNDQQLILESEQIDNINQDNHELELIEDETIDLAKYYGLDNIDTEIDVDNDNNKKYGIVYDVLLKEK